MFGFLRAGHRVTSHGSSFFKTTDNLLIVDWSIPSNKHTFVQEQVGCCASVAVLVGRYVSWTLGRSVVTGGHCGSLVTGHLLIPATYD